MKKTILLALITCSFFACVSPTRIVSTWRDPNVTIRNPGIHKIVVAALLNDQSVRRQIEDYMVTLYPGSATQSYLVLGNDSLMGNENLYNQKLKGQGFDGIVIMKQVNMSVSQHYVPGMYPSYYRSWGGFWGPGWGATYYNPGWPGYVQTNRTWSVQVNVYSLEKNNLIWAANTRTTNPGGRIPLFMDVCTAVRAKMKYEGFLL
jgi:hypothetical protein